jgi:membrane protein implicated in regulation of membrane protease activity
MRRILFADVWSILALILSLLGLVFGVVGAALTISLVAAFVGVPFLGLGILSLAAGIAILVWRYQTAQRIVEVLEQGEAALGEILSVHQNYQIQVNGRYPWTVEYLYEVSGEQYSGQVTTLSRPDLRQQPGGSVYVLHMPDDPAQNTIYPSPYGYYGV